MHISFPVLRFKPSSRAQFGSAVTKLSAAQCSSLKAAMNQADAPAAAKCEIEVDVVLHPVKSAQTDALAATPASGTWYTYEEQATACWRDNAIWNGPNSSASCRDEGYFGITDQFATNGHWLNLHWENPYAATSIGFTLNKTWAGVTGNNTDDMTVGDNYNWYEPKNIETGTAELRIYNGVCDGYYTCESASAWWQHT
jgi:hypothetical protein